MMKRIKYGVALWGLLVFALCSPLYAAELREWTSSKGSALKAELVSKTDTHLTLRKESGKEMTIAIKQLSNADQDYLKQLDDALKDEEPSSVDKAKKPRAGSRKEALLPVLAVGKGAGYFAYFEGDHYIARINANATMDIYLKKEGQGSGLLDEWKMVVEPIAYRKNKLGTISAFRIMEILKHENPIEDPDKVELSVKLKGDIKCDFIYEFTAEGVTTWMKTENGYDPPEVMNHMMTHRLGSVRELTNDPKDLEKMRLKIKSEKYDYLDKHRINSTTSNDTYEISMPAITSTKIIFDKGSDKNVRLMTWKYGDDPLSKGFFVRARKGVYSSTKHNAEKTTITFKGK